VLKTDLSVEEMTKEDVHGRYKDLMYVERAFREIRWPHLSRPKREENKVENYPNKLRSPFSWAKYTSAGVL
jgi:hypothetical protein